MVKCEPKPVTKTFSLRNLTSFCGGENCEFKRFKDKFVGTIMAVRPSIGLSKFNTQVKYVLTATRANLYFFSTQTNVLNHYLK